MNLVEVRLFWKNNKVKPRESKFKTPTLDKDGKEEWFPRNNWLAKLGSDGKPTEWIQNEGELVEMMMYRTNVTAGKIRFIVRDDGNYSAEEADRFNNYETLKHTFTVKDGCITEGFTKKGSNGEQLSSGFSLEHINANGELANHQLIAPKAKLESAGKFND